MVRIGVHAHDFFADIFRLIGQINTVAEGFAHLCAVQNKPAVAVNLFGQRKAESHQHDGPHNGVETDYLLADDVNIAGPVFFEH